VACLNIVVTEGRATGHTDRSRKPHDGCRRKAAHAVATHKDQAATYEADAGDDLRCNTGGVEDYTARHEHIAEAVFRN